MSRRGAKESAERDIQSRSIRENCPVLRFDRFAVRVEALPRVAAAALSRAFRATAGGGCRDRSEFPVLSDGRQLVIGIDLSPRMLARAERRRGLSPVPIELRLMDVTSLDFANDTFDAAVSTFLFCVLPDRQQAPALRELGRVVKPGGFIRFLEYVRPRGTLRRIVSKIWEPWVAFAYGASFDRHTESHIPAAGLEVDESRYVVDDLVKLICARARR